MKSSFLIASCSIICSLPLCGQEAVESKLADEVAEPATEEKSKPSVLTFADETTITGFPSSIDGAKKLLTLKSSSLAGETTLKTDRLLEMSLRGKPRKLESDHYAIATVKEHYQQDFHDSIRGRLVKLDENEIILETWYASQLTLQRKFIQSLDIYNQSPSFYEGPDGPEGWVSASGDLSDNWIFRDRAMISKGRTGIAREVEIPEKAKISFTVDWKSSPYFRIVFFSDDGNRNYPNSGYSLNVQRSYLALYRHAKNARNDDIISESIRSLYNAESATFTIYLDKSKKGTSAIYIDNTEIGNWTGTDDNVLKGKWLHFVPQNDNPIRFSKISVSQWDGVLPARKPKEEGEEKDPDEKDEFEEIRLANGDVVSGNVKKIDAGIASLATGYGDVRVPVKVMRSVGLTGKKDQVIMKENDVRAWFHEGGYITFKLKSLNEKTLIGYSQAWGEAEFDLNAFSRIEFNIWRPELDAARYGTGSDW
ncbi:MAG: hypothetical protein ACPGJR_14360 [Akkermansiaceae bacterium]